MRIAICDDKDSDIQLIKVAIEESVRIVSEDDTILPFVFVNGEGLDVALVKMIAGCEEEGIHFSYSVLCDLSGFDHIELLRLTDNLFKNALEAVKAPSAEPEIKFRIFRSEDDVTFMLKNGIASSVLQNNPKLQTGKSDKIFHGYGMENILGIIKKYDGVYECWEEENIFCQRIVIRSDYVYASSAFL